MSRRASEVDSVRALVGETGRSSYRKASAKWHPDKWINASKAAQAEAAKKFLAVQQAYEGTLQ